VDNLVAETPAIGILKTHEFDDAMFYSVLCQCGNPDDMIEFNVELETDSCNIVLNTYFTPKTAYWNRLVDDSGDIESAWLWSIDYYIRSIINRWYSRVLVMWELLTKGYVQYQQSTIMSEQQALNYAAAINQSIEDLRKFKKNMDVKREEKYSSEEQGGC